MSPARKQRLAGADSHSSPAMVLLSCALAKALDIEALELPWHEGPRLFGPREIGALLPLFKQFAPAAEQLAKPPRQPKPNGNATPPLGEPPKIPDEEPLSARLKHAFIKQAANWLRRAALGAAFGPAGEYFSSIVSAAHTAAWLYDKLPMLQAALDRPKLEDLQSAICSPRKGYEVHHIVE